jgi:hypothetical protein
MVGATGIEPVTPTMSTWGSRAHLVDFYSLSIRPVTARKALFSRFFADLWKYRGNAPAATGALS